MRIGRSLAVLLLLAAASVPSVGAVDCITGVTPLCEAADDYNLDRLFGAYADVGAIVGALFVLALLLTVVLVLLRTPRARPRIATVPRDGVKEIAPGETVQLIVDVENRRRRTSVDVALDLPYVPDGWTALGFGASAFASGFTAPQALPPGGTLHLSSRNRGNHKGAVAVALTAPPDVVGEDSLDFPMRLVPVTGGVPRWGRSRRHRFTLLLSNARPLVQIVEVAHTPDKITPGKPVVTRATVTNEGNAEAHNVGVNFLLNDQVIQTQTVGALGVRQQTVIEFGWTPVVGENRIRIHVA